MNNTKQFSPGEGILSLKLVAIEIEPRWRENNRNVVVAAVKEENNGNVVVGRFSGPCHSGNHEGKRMLESKPLTFL